MFVNGVYPGKSLKSHFLSPGKPYIWSLQLLVGPGKRCFNVCTNPVIANISGTQQDIVSRKMALQTMDTPAQANLIWCTLNLLVH